jgi:hypothetical protein
MSSPARGRDILAGSRPERERALRIDEGTHRACAWHCATRWAR